MLILEKARRLASEVGGQIEAHADLANTLSDLVEWPGLVRGSFAPEFLELPEEITVTAMRTHQKYVPVRGPGGLLPHFVAVMDNSEDRKGFIAKGSEWVLNARLADARFFFEADVQERLEARVPALERLTFQDRLGDYRQKTRRLEDLAEEIARLVGRADLVEAVRSAAFLSKADLTTLVVKEFTDLQGIMGGIYARRERHPDAVWKAIYDQYRPASGSDDPPREASGAILSLADRFDSLCSLFRIGLVPTGSKDPYGLRRAALGAVSIAIARNWRTDWRPIARKALSLLPPDLPGPGPEETLEELGRFFAERLRAILERRGHSYDEISAVVNVGVWDFADAADRARALSDARRHMDFRTLILAFKRIRNIVGSDSTGAPDPELYREDAERVLAADFLQARQAIAAFVGERLYREAMETIASIAPSLDRYFVDVLVNCPERGSEAQPAGAARLDSERVHEPRRLFRNRGGEMKRVFSFGNGAAEGAGLGKETLGGKGAGLAEMTALGIPVPPGFTIETSVCADVSRGASLDGIRAEVESALLRLEHDADKRFGDPENPLLVSVRSGARSSMPGMMDTILNLGLTSRTVPGLGARSGERFALDCRRRFLEMYGDVVLRVPRHEFEKATQEVQRARGVPSGTDLSAADLAEVVRRGEQIIRQRTGRDFPDDPREQLWGAIAAVFRSWENERAKTYRKLNHIPDDWGTAVNVQAMVFGNRGETSATGVAFTRDPASGEKKFYGEFLPNAQGEDVVAGIRTPRPLNADGSGRSLEETMPQAYAELQRVRERLEQRFRDMQDLEFTIEENRLYLLQTRNGKRTGFAAVRIATDMVDEGLIDADEAVARVEPEQLVQLLAPIFTAREKAAAVKEGRLLGKGLPAGPGAACGRIALTAERAVAMAAKGEPVVLVREETSPEDIAGMHAAVGVLTTRGGATSHAAVVARGMGKTCVVGAGEITVDHGHGKIRARKLEVSEGDWISVDGTAGEILVGKLATQPSEVLQVVLQGTIRPEDSPVYRAFQRILEWADARRRLGVRANADTPHDARVARLFGAEGIGLCRTEHMFFEAKRIPPCAR